MLKSENQPVIDTLLEMGYKPDMITFAMAESQNKSLEEVLDLLMFRERHYQKALRKEKEKGTVAKPKKKYSLDEQPKVFKPSKKSKNGARYDSESGEDWIDEDLIDREEPIEVTRIGFGQVPKSVKLGKSKSEIKSEEKLEELPNEMDEESKNHLDGIIQNLKNTNFKDANTCINFLTDHLALIRTNDSEANKTLQKYIVSTGTFPQILELKNQFFAMLSKVLNMRIKKNITVEIKKLEQVLLDVFEMRLMSPKQLDSTINLFSTFCERLSYTQDPVFETKLEKYYSDATKHLPISWRPPFMNKPEKPQEQGEKINIENQDQDEERKVTDLDDIAEAEEHQENADVIQLPEGFDFTKYANTRVVEDCIICMEKTREIVFLPCCHFLTCPLCSPRVMKCPMCNKRIDKHLKIHWS